MKIERSKKKVRKRQITFGFVLVLSSLVVMYAYNEQEQKRKVFENLSVTFKDDTAIEYGSKDYDALSFIEKSSGDVEVKEVNIDPMNIGKQEVVLEVEKDGIERTFSMKVEIKDTKAPQIKIKEENISLFKGNSYNPLDNIESVYDLVDGNIPYIPKEELQEDQKNYYTYETNLDTENIGQYEINVIAIDRNGNRSSAIFHVNVEEEEIESPILSNEPSESVTEDVSLLNQNTVADGSKEGIVNVTYTLLGLPYIAGGNSPSGFDCSGLVSYVYNVNGITVPRTTSGQLYIGANVSLEEAMPGDIIVWSTNTYGSPTHTAIYVGGGNMIHAANPRKGVILSNVQAWASYGSSIVSIRRI